MNSLGHPRGFSGMIEGALGGGRTDAEFPNKLISAGTQNLLHYSFEKVLKSIVVPKVCSAKGPLDLLFSFVGNLYDTQPFPQAALDKGTLWGSLTLQSGP